MKLSARNILPGRVIAVTKGTTTAHVKIELAPGLVVFSAITNEAVDDLADFEGIAVKNGDDVEAARAKLAMIQQGLAQVAHADQRHAPFTVNAQR